MKSDVNFINVIGGNIDDVIHFVLSLKKTAISQQCKAIKRSNIIRLGKDYAAFPIYFQGIPLENINDAWQSIRMQARKIHLDYLLLYAGNRITKKMFYGNKKNFCSYIVPFLQAFYSSFIK